MFEVLVVVVCGVVGATLRGRLRYAVAAAAGGAVFVVSGEAGTEPWLLAFDLALAVASATAAGRVKDSLARRHARGRAAARTSRAT